MPSWNKTTHLFKRLATIAILISFLATALLFAPARKAEAIGGAISRIVVISQAYGGGGNAGSTFTHDFIELYNRSTTPVNMSGWSVQYTSATGTTWQTTNLSGTLQPGQYYLVQEAQGAGGTTPLPTPDATGAIAMSATVFKVALVNSTTALTGACPSAVTSTPAVIDFLGSGGTANCSETAVATAPTNTTANVRNGGGNTETDNNSTDFTTAAPTPRNTASAFNTPTAADGTVSGRIVADDGAPVAGAVVRMTGSQTRKTITDAGGYYRFDDVETTGFYTVSPANRNFSFSPAERSFSQLGSNTEAIFTGSRVGSDNPLDTPEYFVRQHYLDFLGREPDELGFNFWSDQILGCGGDAACNERRTINVSAAYFLSAEFQQTGALLDRLYKASFGRGPLYAEFVPDRAALARNVVVGMRGWEADLLANRESFLESWVERPVFRAAYDNLANDAYVDTLLSNTGVSFSAAERDALLAGLSSGSLSRAGVLAEIAGNASFARARFNEAFVTAEYFGYLRRDPDSRGFSFWLNKLNEFDGNFERADMVKAFLVSGEYRARFGR